MFLSLLPLFTDVSPHLVFKRCGGSHATLWPFDLPFPADGDDDGDDGETKTDQAHKSDGQKTHTENGYTGECESNEMVESRTFSLSA